MPFSAKQDLDGVMSDMRAQKALRESLDPLSEAGFGMSDVMVIAEYDQVERKVTVLSRDGEDHFVLQLPTPILKDSTGRLLLSSLWLLFPTGSSIFLFLSGVDALPIELENILKASRGLTVRFVPWVHVADRVLSHPRKVHLLLAALGLHAGENSPAATVVTPAGPAPRTPVPGRRRLMDDAERALIVSNLAEATLSFGDQAAFHEVIGRLTLGEQQRHVAGCLWADDRYVSALKLVKWAECQGGDVLDQLLAALIESAPHRGEVESLREILSTWPGHSAAGPTTHASR
jgi:hypothetical protein